MPESTLKPGDRVKLNPAGESRYPHRKGQSGRVERLSEAAVGLVAVRWEGTSTVDYYRAECLEPDKS